MPALIPDGCVSVPRWGAEGTFYKCCWWWGWKRRQQWWWWLKRAEGTFHQRGKGQVVVLHRLLLAEFSINAHLWKAPCTSSFYWHRAQKEWTCVFPFVCVSLCEDHTQQPLAHSWMGGGIFARKPGPVWVPWPPYGLWEGPQGCWIIFNLSPTNAFAFCFKSLLHAILSAWFF